MDSLQSLLTNSKPSEPPQLKALREYMKKNHAIDAKVAVSAMNYSVVVPNGMIATNLRMDLPNIQRECNLDKRLMILIGKS